MMTGLRATFFVSASLAAVVAAVSSCSEDRTLGAEEVVDSGPTETPEASLPPTNGDDSDGAPPPIVRPPFDPADVPVTCSTDPCAVELVAGDNHFCARMNDGTVRCWGDNAKGALGTGFIDGGVDAGFRPTQVVGLSGVTQISASEFATCARLDDGTVHCWGGNAQGQLGLQQAPLADSARHPTPAPVGIGAPLARVDVGRRSVCSLISGGGLVCWGGNDKLQLTRVDAGSVGTPGRVDLLESEVTRTAASNTTVFGITNDGRLLTWGAISGRESSMNPDPVPFPLPTLAKVTSVAAGPAHTCAIANGELYCWGTGSLGALGTGLPDNERFPAHAPIQNTPDQRLYPQQVAVSANITCVRITDGTIQCAGDDTNGAFGTGSATSPSAVFTKASALTGYAVHVATSRFATCALLRTGEVQCWGGNTLGELGQGTRDTEPHPTPANVEF